MKCVILHESPGRLRLHAAASRMTLTQADAWEAYLKALPGVRDAAVYDRTGDLVITYRGSREEILKAVGAFSYEKHGELAPANSSGHRGGVPGKPARMNTTACPSIPVSARAS